MRLTLCVVALLCLSGPPPPQTPEPFVPIGVWYGGGTARAPMVVRDPAPQRDAWRRDLATIKSLGFNSVKTWIDWGSGEPERGRYRFDALEQLLSLADEAGLKVIVQIYTDAAPEWLGKRYPDSSFVSDHGARIGSQASPGYCLDHAGVRADMVAFIGAVSAAAASAPDVSTRLTSGASRTWSTGSGSTRRSSSATARTPRHASASG